ncbi:Rieske (2Fe-2S) protein [Amorphus sp. 3PC139-8]|uniref:Rieske (2Fe-2S) protein n=1 Tax=Amorphus sp. 3PC139-8 TaxID=2735676 RepID=UPI00345CFC96
MTEVLIGRSDEFGEGDRRLVVHGNHEIVFMKVKGKNRAFLNTCPHQGGPVCDGLLVHKVEEVISPTREYIGMAFSEDTIHIVCPWHGWEFDVETGACAGDGGPKLRRFDVIERDGLLYARL